MKKVIHLIPYDGIGGVETAARSMSGLEQDEIDFQVKYIYPKVSANKQRLITFNPFYLFRAASQIISLTPDLLIVSLWRSCLVCFLVKIFRPHLKVVLFLHATNHAHWSDRLMTNFTSRYASQIWADSDESLRQRLPNNQVDSGQVISFVTSRIPALPQRHVSPDFIFWGRIHPRKCLKRALCLFAAIRLVFPDAHFKIIGPDGGDLEHIKTLADKMNVSDSVSFLNEMSFDEIVCHAKAASFFLQTSLFEGMAMSVVEAMQLGLVPVVTPVGEINNYCRADYNAFFIESDTEVIARVQEILNDNVRYSRMREHAISTWRDKPLYAESIINACKSIVCEQM